MPLLRLASSDVDRLFLDDSKTDWVEVKHEISKRERNAIIAKMPVRPGAKSEDDIELTPTEALDFQSSLFEAFVVGWSAAFEPTLDNYLNLPSDAVDAIDLLLAEHFRALAPTKDEQGKQ